MKGFNFSFGFTVVGKDKDSKKSDEEGPLPKPKKILLKLMKLYPVFAHNQIISPHQD